MQAWEYAWVWIDTRSGTYGVNGVSSNYGEVEGQYSVLNKLGGEGWELVTAELARGENTISVFLFKRPLQEPYRSLNVTEPSTGDR